MTEFPGLTSVLPHLLAVLLLWGFFMIVAKMVSRNFLKWSKDEDKPEIKKWTQVANSGMTSLAILIAIMCVFFLTSPFERTYHEMEAETIAPVDATFVEPTKEEIEQSNEVAVTKVSDQKRKDATEDNTQAMKDAGKLFQEAADAATSSSE